MTCGIVILDKPSGLGSNAVLGRLKRLLGEKKMGFLGTLDPLASGVLPIFAGKATRLIPLFEKLPKTYRVTLKLGERTDTFDAAGRIIASLPLGDVTDAEVREAILSRAGKQQQAVPSFAAVKVAGVPAYKLARQGRAVPERMRDVDLWDIEVEQVSLPQAAFRVTCSAGTYMRSLVEDLGLALGPGAHLTALERLACGNLFTLEDSVTLACLEASLNKGPEGAQGNEAQSKARSKIVRNPAAFLPEFKPLVLSADAESRLRNGQSIPIEAPRGYWTPGELVKALRAGGDLVAVGEVVSLAAQPGIAAAKGADTPRLGFRPTRVLI